jgi:hypothetical protein
MIPTRWRVDYVCTVGTVLYAFEHTGIEPFADQIELEVHNRKLFGPIVERFSNRADRELWEFHVPVEASAGLTGGQVSRVQDALIKWIEANAARFPVTLLYYRYANPHHIANAWWVTCLRRPGKTYYDDGKRFHEVDPATLVGLTKR